LLLGHGLFVSHITSEQTLKGQTNSFLRSAESPKAADKASPSNIIS